MGATRGSLSQPKIGLPKGYVCTKFGTPFAYPNYTIPRDENSNFFKHVTRSTKNIPGPGSYKNLDMSWKTPNGTFGVGPARKTFTDEAAKIAKTKPSAATYNPQKQYKIPLGFLEKSEGVDYASDCQYLGKTNPSPSTYVGDVSEVKMLDMMLIKCVSSYSIPRSRRE